MPAPVLFTRLQLPTITDNLHRTMIGCYMNIIYVIYFFHFFIVGTGGIPLCWMPLFMKRNKKHFFTVGTRIALHYCHSPNPFSNAYTPYFLPMFHLFIYNALPSISDLHVYMFTCERFREAKIKLKHVYSRRKLTSYPFRP